MHIKKKCNQIRENNHCAQVRCNDKNIKNNKNYNIKIDDFTKNGERAPA